MGAKESAPSTRGRTREEPEVRKRRILDASARLFATRGFADTTVRDIAEAVDLLSGSLYHHFTSKEAILEAVMREFMVDMEHTVATIATSELPAPERFDTLVRHAFAQTETRPFHVRTYQAEFQRLSGQDDFAFINELSSRIEQHWIDTMSQATESFPGNLDVLVRYRMVRDAVWGVVHWYRPGQSHAPAQLAEEYLTAFHGMSVPRPAASASV